MQRAEKDRFVYEVHTLRSEDLSRNERGDWWRDQVSSIHCPLSFELPNDYSGRLEHQQSDAYQLVRWWGDAEDISRDEKQIRYSPHGAYEVLVPAQGVLSLRQDDQTSQVGPAQVALTSLDRALDLRHGDGFSSFAFVVPRERLDARLPRLPRT